MTALSNEVVLVVLTLLHPGGCDCRQFPEDVPCWHETVYNTSTPTIGFILRKLRLLRTFHYPSGGSIAGTEACSPSAFLKERPRFAPLRAQKAQFFGLIVIPLKIAPPVTSNEIFPNLLRAARDGFI
ncbi:hypothetical protein EVAR_19034_1 [Eumeta japonica]|uniref:Secreted protein n=1 Tax=Eumeta variegata TaxID=151549 RepID=A0A4C1V756_EUMVA|nr:hypothetical protein EVAR_19034_1 [Eumeta japonica]